jgi:hypothetical protein
MKKVLGVFLLLVILLGGTVYYFTQRDYRNDIKYHKADEELSALELYAAFEADEEKANTRFLGKTLLVTGVAQSVEQEGTSTTIKLETGDPLGSIVCEMNTELQSDFGKVNEGQSVSIKGECSGKLFDIILVNSIIN